MNDDFVIKSRAGNRLRIKSVHFAKESAIEKVKKAFENDLEAFRANRACRSVVLRYRRDRIDEAGLMARLRTLFPKTSVSAPAATACGIEGSCVSCERKRQEPGSFRRKLIEFGLLSGFALYLFVKESILGVAVAASPLSWVAAVSVYAALPLLKESYEDIKEGRFTLQTFMSGALMMAIGLGEATAAFEIIYILRGGMLLEEYIANRSKEEIHRLVELDVKKVFVLVDGAELEVEMQKVRPGDVVVCRAGEKIPVDGVVQKGEGEVDESIINGRSEPAFKQKGDKVFAGTVCRDGRLYIEATALGEGTYIARVMSEVERALAVKSPSEVEADRLASKLLKLGSFMTVATFLVTGSWLSAFSVMIVMSCPCSTVLAASTAISGGIAVAAKQGILIKGGEALEKVSQSEVFCFDKTGTLTTGEPLVSDIVILGDLDEAELLRLAAAAEYRNTHPIARAIVKKAEEKGQKVSQAWEIEVLPGFGVVAKGDERRLIVGNARMMARYKISVKPSREASERLHEEGKTVVYVAEGRELLGLFGVIHEVRPGTRRMIEDLRNRGVRQIVLLTGDEKRVAEAFAKRFGFDAVFSEQTPRDKAATVEALGERYDNVVMIGDGVNDTLAMSRADVAVAFAASGNEAAIEVADIAVSHSHPWDIVALYDLSKKTMEVVHQNFWIGTSTNIAGVAFAMMDKLSPTAAAAIHIGHTVGIMANSSRLMLLEPADRRYLETIETIDKEEE